MTNREIAQEISNRIGTAPVPFDSVYSIALQIYNELGGEQTQFDSVYSILLEILPLVEGGGGGKAIEEVSELPNASENKDKLFRLDNGEKDVYVAKLLSSETTTTNRLPDEQQIDKAYLWKSAEYQYHYVGAYTATFSDGEVSGYGWLDYHSEYEWYFYLTEVDAEHIQTNSVCYYFEYDKGDTIDLVNKTITTQTSKDDYKATLSEASRFPIPATYNAPESAQIGNADCEDAIYTGNEITLVVSDGERTGWKWSYTNGNFEVTNKPASEMYCKVNAEEGENYCDTKFIYVNLEEQEWTVSGNTYTNLNYTLDDIYWMSNTEDEISNIYIPQLNAPDSEQVDNANITAEGLEFKYEGDTLYTLTDDYQHTYYGYKWICTEDDTMLVFTHEKASDIYGGNTVIYLASGLDGWSYIGDNTYHESGGESINYGTLDDFGYSYSTVKYQRTETTEEWGWEKVATEDELYPNETTFTGATLTVDGSQPSIVASGTTAIAWVTPNVSGKSVEVSVVLINTGSSALTPTMSGSVQMMGDGNLTIQAGELGLYRGRYISALDKWLVEAIYQEVSGIAE